MELSTALKISRFLEFSLPFTSSVVIPLADNVNAKDEIKHDTTDRALQTFNRSILL